VHHCNDSSNRPPDALPQTGRALAKGSFDGKPLRLQLTEGREAGHRRPAHLI
jgi:hypothetical protein